MIAGLRLWPNPAYVTRGLNGLYKDKKRIGMNGSPALRGGEREM
jgi:hypothetical protein